MASACLGVPTEADFDEAVCFIYDLLRYSLGSSGKDWDVREVEIIADIQEREMERRPHCLATITLRFGDTVLEHREKSKEQWNIFIQNYGKEMFTDDEHFNNFLESFCETNFEDSFVEDFLKYCIFVFHVAMHCYDSGEVRFVDNILWFTRPLLKYLFIRGKLIRFDAEKICKDLVNHYFDFEFENNF